MWERLARLTPSAGPAMDLFSHPLAEMMLGGSLHPGGAGATKWLLAHSGLTPGDRIVDLACGRADAVAALVDWVQETGTGPIEYVGLDRDRLALAAGARALTRRSDPGRGADGPMVRTSLACADLPRHVPVRAGSASAVLSECALCLTDAPATLQLVHGLLANGGRLLWSDVTLEEPLDVGDPMLGRLGCLLDARPASALRGLFDDAGFEVVRFEDKTDWLAEMRARIHVRADVRAIAEALDAAGTASDTPRNQGVVAVVDAVEEAFATGSLRYHAGIAQKRQA